MKFIIFLCLFLSSCVYVPIYSIKENDDDVWIHRITGNKVTKEILSICSTEASLTILKRHAFSNKVDVEYLDNIDRIRNIEGRCLYDKGFVFKVGIFSAYCYVLEDVCRVYNKYRK